MRRHLSRLCLMFSLTVLLKATSLHFPSWGQGVCFFRGQFLSHSVKLSLDYIPHSQFFLFRRLKYYLAHSILFSFKKIYFLASDYLVHFQRDNPHFFSLSFELLRELIVIISNGLRILKSSLKFSFSGLTFIQSNL